MNRITFEIVIAKGTQIQQDLNHQQSNRYDTSQIIVIRPYKHSDLINTFVHPAFASITASQRVGVDFDESPHHLRSLTVPHFLYYFATAVSHFQTPRWIFEQLHEACVNAAPEDWRFSVGLRSGSDFAGHSIAGT